MVNKDLEQKSELPRHSYHITAMPCMHSDGSGYITFRLTVSYIILPFLTSHDARSHHIIDLDLGTIAKTTIHWPHRKPWASTRHILIISNFEWTTAGDIKLSQTDATSPYFYHMLNIRLIPYHCPSILGGGSQPHWSHTFHFALVCCPPG